MKILKEYQAKRITELAVRRLSDYVKDNQLKCLVLGISGGLDSAVVAALGLRAIALLKSEGYICRYSFKFLDIESDPIDRKKARELAGKLDFNLEEEYLTPWYWACPNRILNPQTHAERVFNGNIKCRLRMINLMGKAQITEGAVLDTDDLSEYVMGFFTKHGDVGDIKIIQNLTKDEVRDLAEYLGIPKSIVTSAPGDGLGITATNQAQDQLKIPYLKIDYLISRMIYHGFKINGDKDQPSYDYFKKLISEISKEIGEPVENVLHVIRQALKTKFKRVGNDAVILLPSRTEMGLPELGSIDFETLYLDAIRKT